MPDDASATGTGSVAESSDSVILLVRISAAIAGLDVVLFVTRTGPLTDTTSPVARPASDSCD